MKKICIISIFSQKKPFYSQGNIKANKKINFMGPLIYVLPRAPKGLEDASGSLVLELLQCLQDNKK